MTDKHVPIITASTIESPRIKPGNFDIQECPVCHGSGVHNAMQMARYINGPSVRANDMFVPCPNCGGLGVLWKEKQR